MGWKSAAFPSPSPGARREGLELTLTLGWVLGLREPLGALGASQGFGSLPRFWEPLGASGAAQHKEQQDSAPKASFQLLCLA